MNTWLLLGVGQIVAGFAMIALSSVAFASPYFHDVRRRATITIVLGILLMIAGAALLVVIL